MSIKTYFHNISRRWGRLFAALFLGLTLALQASAVAPEVFEKKGKYGLEDVATGKVLLKAKYDTIYPFNGEKYALLRQNGRYGLVDRNGKLYLQCRFKKILFPAFGHRGGKDYFWATTDGISYAKQAISEYHEGGWLNVFYGPDKAWYGKYHNGMWMRIVGFDTVAPLYDMSDDGPSYITLTDDYVIFKGTLYSPGPDRKKIYDNVTRARPVSVAGRRFMKASLTNRGTFLIDLESGEMWEKDGISLNGTYRPYMSRMNYALRIKDNNIYHVRNLIDDMTEMYVVTNPEYDLKSLEFSSRTLLPFRFSDISISRTYGTYRGEELWRVNLTSRQPMFESDLKSLVDEMNRIHPNFIIVSNSSMGSSLFGNTGRELVHFALDKVYTRDNFLIAKVDGEEILMNMEGVAIQGDYDSIWRSQQGNLTMSDLLVSKNGRVGLYVEGRGEIIPPSYEGFMRQWGHIFAYVDKKVGLYDDDGNRIIPPLYSNISIAYAYTDPNYYKVTTTSGATMILDNRGQVIVPAGKIDNVSFSIGDDGKWCAVYNNGKMGILNLQSKRIVIPCQYADNIFYGSGCWPNRKIGVYRTTSAGELIEIWTLSGRKIGSKTFPPSATYSMKRYLENQLNAQFHYYD